MKGCIYVLFVGFGLGFCAVQAQEQSENADVVIARIYEMLTADGGESTLDLTTLADDLHYFAQNPINLNNTTKEELEKLQFLSDKQIENLLYYLYRQKRMQTIYELQLVDGLDLFVIRNLLPFVYVGEPEYSKRRFPSLGEMWKKGKQEVLLRSDRVLEPKLGYLHTVDDAAAEAEGERYVGDPNYLSLKYTFRYRDFIDVGLIGEKDPGEQLWGRYHKGFDFYSGYAQLNHLGRFKILVLGNFRANFGMGLVIHPELNFGKSADVMNVLPRNSGLRKSSSTDEYNFLRGIGATLKAGRSEVSVFYSYRRIDGDSTGTSFSYIKTDGLHRTVSDLDRKNRIGLQMMGGNWNCRFSHLQLGVTIADTRLSRSLEPESKPYNMYYFRGNHQLAGGVYYRYRIKQFTFFGEGATQSRGGFAVLGGFTVTPVSTANLVLLYRNYSKRYDVLLANAFAEGSRVNNEEGVYVGFEVRPIKRWKVTGYVDAYSFPWLRYLVSRPSDGYEALLSANFIPTKKVEMNWRMRYEQKEKNMDNESITDFTGRYDLASMRYWISWVLSRRVTLKSLAEVNRASHETGEVTLGSMLAQEVSYLFKKMPLSLNLRCEWFDATNYDNRIYSYERDVPYVFSVPMLYGRGGRWFGNCRWSVSDRLSIWVKVGQTFYADRNTIGSGLELINKNYRTDMRAMIRFRF